MPASIQPAWFGATAFFVLLSILPSRGAGDDTIVLEVKASDATARVAAPVRADLSLPDSMAGPAREGRLQMTEVTAGAAQMPPVAAQYVPAEANGAAGENGPAGRLTWLLPPAPQGAVEGGKRLFRLGAAPQPPAAVLTAAWNAKDRRVDVSEGSAPVLRYNHGDTEVPKGTGPEFARGDYINLLYGPDGEILTEDYPKDHSHHRAVNWSWATVNWKGQTRDLFAVRGIWSRPVGTPRLVSGPVLSVIEARNEWKWDDKEVVLREVVRICAYRQADRRRVIDITVELTPTVEQFELAGRLGAGYSGFNVRMAPGKGQQILLHNDPPEAQPRRSYADYSAELGDAKGRSGLAILQNTANPLYPSEWMKYPNLNFFQPAYPGPKLISLTANRTVVLTYRLWVHPGAADDKTLADLWDAYNNPPAAIRK